jgi:hypothetical protein
MKNYYGLTNNQNLEYIGKFNSFKEVWDFIEYESDKNFIWIFNENRLQNLVDQINVVLKI